MFYYSTFPFFSCYKFGKDYPFFVPYRKKINTHKICRPLSPFSHCVLNSGSQTVGQAPLEGRGATAGVLGSTRGNVRSEAKLN